MSAAPGPLTPTLSLRERGLKQIPDSRNTAIQSPLPQGEG